MNYVVRCLKCGKMTYLANYCTFCGASLSYYLVLRLITSSFEGTERVSKSYSSEVLSVLIFNMNNMLFLNRVLCDRYERLLLDIDEKDLINYEKLVNTLKLRLISKAFEDLINEYRNLIEKVKETKTS